MGHRRFAFISTQSDQFTLARQQRLEGLRRQMKACGKADDIEVLTTDEKWEVDGLENGQPYEYTIGRMLTADFLARGSRATALIGVNDITALGILQELQERRRGVPQEFSVCGFDNIFQAGIVTPGLTTVDHQLRIRCRVAVDMVVSHPVMPYASAPYVSVVEYMPRLIVRGSTGPVPAQN
ncbi:substrate-binding domain-containing protein [Ruthenibacterium lactatiformans]|uniref:substrate-binding domain-containing protein n=1 Tax=Ruthenibacterium lactatiformans TaxID=1550024 RepID=UPI002665618C|nr:substrate-binding domain-containing protein [Ruthenibacterium lactatiformans]